MAWLTNKETGAHFNTDWLDEDAKRKESQIGANQQEADFKNAENRSPSDSTIEDFDTKSLGELKVTDDEDSFIHENLKNKEFLKFGQEHGMDSIRQLWYEERRQEEIKNLHEVPVEDAIQTVRDNIKESHLSGWFRSADSGYKPRIAEQMFGNTGVLNASMNMAYYNYKNEMKLDGKQPLSFQAWLTTPQEVYRGTSGQKLIDADVFTSYTPSKEVAENFAFGRGGAVGSQHGGEPKVSSMTIRPIDTWGQLQTTGELEFLIPIKIMDKSDKRK